MNTFKLFTTIVLMIGLVLAIGCGKDPVSPQPGPNPNADPDPDPYVDPGDKVDAKIVGEWVFTAATVSGRSEALSDVLEWEASTAMAAFSIGSDGAFIYIEVDRDIELTYSSEGTISTSGDRFEISSPGLSHGGSWRVSGQMLTLTTVEDGAKVVLTSERLEDPAASMALVK